MIRGLRIKILLLTLLPILVVLTAVCGVAIYNNSQNENRSLVDRLNTFRTLIESGDLSFDAVQDKAKLKAIIGEEVVLAEILRSDYSVIYNSEKSAAPLVSDKEKTAVDDAFKGIETVASATMDGRPVLTVVTPLVVNGKISAVLHERLSNVESSARTERYAIFVIGLMLVGLAVCFMLIYWLLAKVVIKNVMRLKDATVEIQKGHFDRKIQIKTNDEIGELATSFNLMTVKLQKSNDDIEKKVKELSMEHGKLSSLVESIKLGVVMVDLRLNVILANPAAKQIFGKPESKTLVFKDLSEKIKGAINISQALSYYVHAGKPLNIQEVAIGENFYRLFMSPVRDINEKIFIGAVVVMEDVTEQKKLDKMRTEIVSITSHQLRTPATIVKGNLEMVMSGDVGTVTKAQKELLDDTYMGNERMIHLINDLMDAAKINEGRLIFPLEPTQLEDVVSEVVNENQPFAREKHVALTFDSPPAPLPKASINREKMKQVFQNLIDNAIKYSSVGVQGKVEVGLRDEDGKRVIFMVKDNGIGIPKGDQAKMFERFSRGSNSTKLDPGGGSGLGLYIAKAVVEQANGKIWFESEEGKGTTFYAAFPII